MDRSFAFCAGQRSVVPHSMLLHSRPRGLALRPGPARWQQLHAPSTSRAGGSPHASALTRTVAADARSAVAAAVLVGTRVWPRDVVDSLVSIGILACDEHDVAVVVLTHMDPRRWRHPRQQRLGAHVVVSQCPAESVPPGVL